MATMLLVSCAPEPANPLAELAPTLSAPWVTALTVDDDAEFVAFARQQGPAYLLKVEGKLGYAYNIASLDSFETSATVLDPALLRVRGALAVDYGFDGKLRRFEEFLALAPEQQLRLVRRVKNAYAIDGDRELPVDQKIASLEGILAEFETEHAAIPTAHLYYQVSQHYGRSGDRAAQRKWLEATVAQGDSQGSYLMSCQALGGLASLAGREDDLDGMFAYLNQGLDLAVEHHIPGQAARFASFMAGYYEWTGRLSLAREYRREAVDLCERLGGDPGDIRFYVDGLQYHARLGCWTIVERDLQHADIHLARMQGWMPPEAARLQELRIQELRARVDMTWGRVDQANARFVELEAAYRELENLEELGRAQLTWGRGLLYNDHPAAAREVLNDALQNSQHPRVLMILHLELARADAELQQWDACASELDAFEGAVLQSKDVLLDAWTVHDALRIRVARSSEPDSARQKTIDAVKIATKRLDSGLREVDAIQEGYFALRNTQPLREELHAIVAGQSELGYALELRWRELPLLLGAGEEAAGLDPLQACAEIANAALQDAEPDPKFSIAQVAPAQTHDALHLLYRVGQKSTERWSVEAGQLDYVSLPLGELQLRESIATILRKAGTAPSAVDASPSISLSQGLHELARGLLPATFFEASSKLPRQIYLSPDGPLNALPFAILNLASEIYLPLIAKHDPVYLGMARHDPDQAGASTPSSFEATGSPSPGAGLIVAEPSLTGTSFAFSSGLPRIELALAEARALHQWRPESRYLEGADATKAAVLDVWEDASFIYFASHMVRDPEAPYLSYLPLSTPKQGARREDSYLDITDVRGAQLHCAPLVVLSACNSGTPYVAQYGQAPGLGEAFLDAGASAVIQTAWAVDDAAAAQLMRAAMHAWALEGRAPERALNQARRAMASSEGAYRHPFYWGGTYVRVRDF